MPDAHDDADAPEPLDEDEVQPIPNYWTWPAVPRLATDLRALRRERGLTQKALAKLLGMSQNRVSALEKSPITRLRLVTLQKVIGALGGNVRLFVEINGQLLSLEDHPDVRRDSD